MCIAREPMRAFHSGRRVRPEGPTKPHANCIPMVFGLESDVVVSNSERFVRKDQPTCSVVRITLENVSEIQ